MPQEPNSDCNCGVPQLCAADTNCPIDWDSELHEFQLGDFEGRQSWVIRYCFNCGKPLSGSKRADLFFEMNAIEVDDVQRRFKSIQSVEALVNQLGEPDVCTSTDGEDVDWPHDLSKEERAYLRYLRYWTTVDVMVPVEKGKIAGLICSPRRK